ncbi:quercetin 2,3-dioxygenase [Microbacterium sp. SSM24]|uniref:quercetin 2,3-dioxygenase n=1 Tax=Microbacterium sp. SSM24 TaxID=2991714 RepID=UPI002227617A|nr:quercetin 2,3-dioxygenase [Microbacterium sp. SSM24]MCW3492618.1 quercetin 2,3-dioxygenase [Microbacterium sp. SSM24]
MTNDAAASTAPPTNTVVVTESERKSLWFLTNLVREIATGADTNGAYYLAEVTAPPGDQAPLHMHTREEEAFLLLEGQVTLWVGDEVKVLNPGDFGLMPRMVPHCYGVTSDVDARWLILTSPAGFEGFVHAVSVPAEEDRIPDAQAPTPEQAGVLAAIGASFGVEMLGAPGMLPTDLKATDQS